MKHGKYIQWLCLIVSVAVLLLGAVPGSIVMRFMGDPAQGGYFYKKVCFYDHIVLGYGNAFPLLTVIFCGIMAVKAAVYLLRRQEAWHPRILVPVAAACAVANLALAGATVIGGVILGLLILLTVAAYAAGHKK